MLLQNSSKSYKSLGIFCGAAKLTQPSGAYSVAPHRGQAESNCGRGQTNPVKRLKSPSSAKDWPFKAPESM
jgi:hypothetical protein